MTEWENLVEKCNQSETLLRQQNYEFPLQWKEFYIIEGEWMKLLKILREKTQSFEDQKESINQNIRKEEDIAIKKIQEIEQQFN